MDRPSKPVAIPVDDAPAGSATDAQWASARQPLSDWTHQVLANPLAATAYHRAKSQIDSAHQKLRAGVSR